MATPEQRMALEYSTLLETGKTTRKRVKELKDALIEAMRAQGVERLDLPNGAGSLVVETTQHPAPMKLDEVVTELETTLGSRAREAADRIAANRGVCEKERLKLVKRART